MRTAVDSSALLCVFKDEPKAPAYLDLMHDALRHGELVVCDVVVAEVGAFFQDVAEYKRILTCLDIRLDCISLETAHFAGQLFRGYRSTGGQREHLIPDFLVGAHALKQANRLIGGDRGFFRRYFDGLDVLTPR